MKEKKIRDKVENGDKEKEVGNIEEEKKISPLEEMVNETEKLKVEYGIYFSYYGSWKYPNSKETRATFASRQYDIAIVESLLVLFMKFFPATDVRDIWLKSLKSFLNAKIKALETETGMTPSLEGLKIKNG